MSSKRKISGYFISGDPDEVDVKDQVPVSLREKLYSYYLMAQRGKQEDIHKLIKAIEKYPKVPQLKNYLTTLYAVLGNQEKAYSANKWMIKEHPDYLFGKINLSNQYLEQKKYEEIPKVLGKDLELKSLYPEREVFHVQEFEAFYQISAMYFAATGNIDQYQVRLAILKEINPDSPMIKKVEDFKLRLLMGKAVEQMGKDASNITRVETKPQKITTTTKGPDFRHAVIDELYNFDLRIPTEIIDQILALPRETLIPDLHLVIEDSIERYGYFLKKTEMEEGADYPPEFPIHALFLLGELESEESLPVVLKMLGQSEEYLEFYFGDMITEAIWEPLFKMANHQQKALKSYLLTPNIHVYTKTAILDVLVQIALHFPARRDSIQDLYRELIDFFLQDELPSDVFDSTMVAFIASTALDMQLDALLPEIKKLFEAGRVDISVFGFYEDFKEFWEEDPGYSNKREVLPIKERYKNIVNTWSGYQETEDFQKSVALPGLSDSWAEKSPTPGRSEKKAGRNDPCPCGSGKKYKKCCWGK